MAVTQASYRGRNDDGTESGASWKAAANTLWTPGLVSTFRVRFLLQVATASSSTGFVLMYSKNGGAYTAVTASSLVVKCGASSVADGTVTTKQLGAGTFVAGSFDKGDGAWAAVTVAAGSETEMEAALQFVPADLKPTDTVSLRVYQTTSIALGAYTNTPTLTFTAPNRRPVFRQQAVSRAANW